MTDQTTMQVDITEQTNKLFELPQALLRHTTSSDFDGQMTGTTSKLSTDLIDCGERLILTLRLPI